MNSEMYVYRPIPPLCKTIPGDDDTPVPTATVFGLVGLLQRYVAAWDDPQEGTALDVRTSRHLMAATCRALAALIDALDARDTAEEGEGNGHGDASTILPDSVRLHARYPDLPRLVAPPPHRTRYCRTNARCARTTGTQSRTWRPRRRVAPCP